MQARAAGALPGAAAPSTTLAADPKEDPAMTDDLDPTLRRRDPADPTAGDATSSLASASSEADDGGDQADVLATPGDTTVTRRDASTTGRTGTALDDTDADERATGATEAGSPFEPARADEAAGADELRGAMGLQAGAIGGTQAGVPAASFPEAGLTPHTQPAEGGREEAEDGGA